MKTKWKVLLISIVIYQVILTFIILDLAHYSQWLYFENSVVKLSYNWYEGNVTAPMRNALIWLGVIFVILCIVNLYQFLKKDKIMKQL